MRALLHNCVHGSLPPNILTYENSAIIADPCPVVAMALGGSGHLSCARDSGAHADDGRGAFNARGRNHARRGQW